MQICFFLQNWGRASFPAKQLKSKDLAWLGEVLIPKGLRKGEREK